MLYIFRTAKYVHFGWLLVNPKIPYSIERVEWNITELNELVIPIIPLEKIHAKDIEDIKNASGLKQYLKEKAVMLYESKEAEFPEPEQFREIERVVLLKVIDRKWMDHIDDMTQLRQEIGLQAYGQRDPLVEYKMAGFDMFDAIFCNSGRHNQTSLLCTGSAEG